ncbi:MAG: hypothetical protein D3M94_10055 [Rhodocyclales bacterium GT-UBC]|nr:MAG: hypothetical protein D3M94_10055 [Rhodocyclales bacterium GT-UBC]
MSDRDFASNSILKQATDSAVMNNAKNADLRFCFFMCSVVIWSRMMTATSYRQKKSNILKLVQ